MPSGVYQHKPHTEEQKALRSRFMKGRYSEETHPAWKGDEVGYSGVHQWVYRQRGRAIMCEFVDETCSTHFEWSNISHEYKRDLSDWQQLCVSHHRRYDGVIPSWVKS